MTLGVEPSVAQLLVGLHRHRWANTWDDVPTAKPADVSADHDWCQGKRNTLAYPRDATNTTPTRAIGSGSVLSAADALGRRVLVCLLRQRVVQAEDGLHAETP
jgi:hypothetical protein